MVRNTLFITVIIYLALTLYVLQECKFLVPYRALIWNRYWDEVLVFAALVFGNLFAGIYCITRKLFLKDTGRKLAHLERQWRSGPALADELRDLTEH